MKIRRPNTPSLAQTKPHNRSLDISKPQGSSNPREDSVSLSPAALAAQRGGNTATAESGENAVRPHVEADTVHDLGDGRDRISDRADGGMDIYKTDGQLTFRDARVGSTDSEYVTDTFMNLGDAEVRGTLSLVGDTRTVIDGGNFDNLNLAARAGGDHEVILNLSPGAAIPRVSGTGQSTSIAPEDWQREDGIINMPGVQRLLIMQEGESVASFGEPIVDLP